MLEETVIGVDGRVIGRPVAIAIYPRSVGDPAVQILGVANEVEESR